MLDRGGEVLLEKRATELGSIDGVVTLGRFVY